MVHTSFFTNLEVIDFFDSLPEELFNELNSIIIQGDISWRSTQFALYPPTHKHCLIKQLIEQLKPIVEFLNRNKVKWFGKTVPFKEYTCDDFVGFFVIEKENVALSYVMGPGEISTEYIPITSCQKIL